jgi:ABC-2 type transport system permease protein/sodium transport system permease protein
MTVTGAVYPAIDLTAGERERGTLETLIAAPVPRVGLLLAKYVAVLTVALLTAMVNLAGMAITSHSTGLNVSLFGGTGLTFAVIVKVLLLLGLFAAFFSAVLLAITSYARSFKEAQAYIIPLMLLCLVPGIICLMPSLEFSGTLAVIPLVNIVLLARDLLEGSVNSALAAAAVFSTLLYVVAAIAIAARIFGTDAILYGGESTWSDLVRRPATVQSAASPAAAMFALAAMFPSYFLLSNELLRSPELSMARRLIVSALITALVFGAIPWLVALWHRVSIKPATGWIAPSAASVIAAGLLGVALWPLWHELFLLNEWLGIWTIRAEQLESVRRLLDEWRSVPWVLVVATLAIVPAVFEELFFRGMFWTSLRTIMRPVGAIVTSAVVFGLFHVVAANVLAPERFLPSACLGLVLGWIRFRSGSVIPCIVLHAVHNGVLLSIAYWRDELAAQGIGIDEATHLPAGWLVLAAGVTAVAVAIVLLSSRGAPKVEPLPVAG